MILFFLMLMPNWDYNQADFVLWTNEGTEVFYKQGKSYAGGECEDIVFYDGGCTYYWRTKDGQIVTTLVKSVWFEVGDWLIEIDEHNISEHLNSRSEPLSRMVITSQ